MKKSESKMKKEAQARLLTDTEFREYLWWMNEGAKHSGIAGLPRWFLVGTELHFGIFDGSIKEILETKPN